MLKKLAETTTAEGSTASKPSPENVFDNQANSFAALEVEDSAWGEELDHLTMANKAPTMLASPDTSLEAGKPDEFQKTPRSSHLPTSELHGGRAFLVVSR